MQILQVSSFVVLLLVEFDLCLCGDWQVVSPEFVIFFFHFIFHRVVRPWPYGPVVPISHKGFSPSVNCISINIYVTIEVFPLLSILWSPSVNCISIHIYVTIEVFPLPSILWHHVCFFIFPRSMVPQVSQDIGRTMLSFIGNLSIISYKLFIFCHALSIPTTSIVELTSLFI